MSNWKKQVIHKRGLFCRAESEVVVWALDCLKWMGWGTAPGDVLHRLSGTPTVGRDMKQPGPGLVTRVSSPRQIWYLGLDGAASHLVRVERTS